MRKFLCYLMMVGALAGWVFAIAGIVRPFKNETLRKIWKSVAFTWVFGHPLELMVSRSIGRAAGIPAVKTVIKTILFGVTWWLPVKLGLIRG
jgi:hypothetical protein